MTRKPWTAGKGKIKVRWNKQDNVTRYEVRYSKNKSFKKGTYKTKKVNAAVNAYTTQSTTLSGLNSGYTYYVKVPAGAVSHMKVARVPNIPSLLKDLKKQGVWVFGTAANGTTGLYDADLKGAAAIVIGSEGDGMTRLAAENCDFLVSIPMRGKLNSLNASAAAAILLYEAVRQRMA